MSGLGPDRITVGGGEELDHGVSVSQNTETGEFGGFLHVSIGPLEVKLSPTEAREHALCIIRCSQKAQMMAHVHRVLAAEGLEGDELERRALLLAPMSTPDPAEETRQQMRRPTSPAGLFGPALAERILSMMGGRKAYSVEDLFNELGIGPDGPAKPKTDEGGEDDRGTDARGTTE